MLYPTLVTVVPCPRVKAVVFHDQLDTRGDVTNTVRVGETDWKELADFSRDYPISFYDQTLDVLLKLFPIPGSGNTWVQFELDGKGVIPDPRVFVEDLDELF